LERLGEAVPKRPLLDMISRAEELFCFVADNPAAGISITRTLRHLPSRPFKQRFVVAAHPKWRTIHVSERNEKCRFRPVFPLNRSVAPVKTADFLQWFE
jgi:hypothetical protein